MAVRVRSSAAVVVVGSSAGSVHPVSVDAATARTVEEAIERSEATRSDMGISLFRTVSGYTPQEPITRAA